MTSVRRLVRDCRRAPRDDQVAAGMLEGLTDTSRRSALTMGPDEGREHFSGRLVGRFAAWVEAKRPPLEDALLSDAIPYLTVVGTEVARGGWDPAARDHRAFLRIHTTAMIYVERRSGAPTPVGHENVLVSWLAGQAAMRATETAGSTLGRLRHQRLERRFGPG